MEYDMKSLVRIALISAGIAAATPSWATHYDFSLTWNGLSSSYSVNSGATNPVGVNIALGDSFVYKLFAANDDFWRVISGGEFFPFLAFSAPNSARRIVDVSLKLFDDGIEVFSWLDHSEIHSHSDHMGTKTIALSTGLEFDQAVLDYELISLTPGYFGDVSTIANIAWPYGVPFAYFDGGTRIKYIDNRNSVPEPATLALFSLGLLGISALRRRKSA